MKRNLSKSRCMLGLQCHKRLWLSVHERNHAAPTDPATQWRFDSGHEIGDIAQDLFPGGTLISEDHFHTAEAIDSTVKAVSSGATALYEATVSHNRTLCRADIIQRKSALASTWDMFEVKATTKVKPQHIPDVAVQRHCFEGAGFPIRDTYLTHVNNQYVRHGEIEPDKLFVSGNVSAQVGQFLPEVGPLISTLLKVVDSPRCPRVEVGPQCTDPYECDFYDYCHGEPEPGDLTGKPVVDRTGISRFLDTLEYPLYFFDFETITPGIPRFDGTRPYQQVPFQFSLHVQQKPGGPVKHVEFLPTCQGDPREPLAKAMLDNLGNRGSILAWWMSFEKTRIKELARDCPGYARRLEALLPRFRDLIVPFKRGYYDHPGFGGSASLKNVVPVLLPKLSYDNLEIQGGTDASAVAEQWFAGGMDEKKWAASRENLLKYCERDTIVMVEILEILHRTAR